jgi:hypothetical protein
MNKRIKQLAVKTFETIKNNPKVDPSNQEAWIDAYVLELTRNVVFACSDVIREKAKDASPEVANALKVAAIDMLDEFGL